MEDPYESFRISTSQEELLNSVPFVGDTLTSPCNCNCNCNNHHHSAAAAAEIIPPVILFSAPDTQHVDNQDVFHTPPPLPSSVIDVPQCEFNQAVIDVDDDVSQILVHFPGFEKDSELGFVEKSRFLEEDRLSEFPEIHPDEFSVLDRAISDFDKAPVELGFDCLEKNVENDAEDVNKSSEEEIIEIFRMRKGPVLDLMTDSIRSSFEKATANDKEKEKHTFTVFDVLKVLAETTAVKEEDDGLTVLETAKRAGVIFPRPTWWPEDMKSQLFNF